MKWPHTSLGYYFKNKQHTAYNDTRTHMRAHVSTICAYRWFSAFSLYLPGKQSWNSTLSASLQSYVCVYVILLHRIHSWFNLMFYLKHKFCTTSCNNNAGFWCYCDKSITLADVIIAGETEILENVIQYEN